VSLVRSLIDRRNVSDPTNPITGAELLEMFGATPSSAGIAVTPESSLQCTAVYACVRLISESIAAMPVDLIERKGKVRRVVDDAPMAYLLNEEPNPEQDAGEFWRYLLTCSLLHGNAFVYPQWNNATGTIDGFWPIPPGLVEPKRLETTKELMYVLRVPSGTRAGTLEGTLALFPGKGEILHYKALGTGLMGLSPIGLAREAVGLAMAAEQYGAKFFGQGARPGGVIAVPGKLSDQGYERMQTQWKKAHEGLSRSHLTAILEQGATWQAITLPPEDAQFIETRRYQLGEIARLYGVAPHMIGDVERSTSWGKGIESQALQTHTMTLTPWLTRLERTTQRAIRRQNEFWRMRFNPAGLLRGDLAARYRAYTLALQGGWKCVNEVRALEDDDPVPGGDVYRQLANMQPAESAPAPA